ncbi:MAG TPA: glycosyltransferase family 39 protein [Dissulfurispiraceae bacterium]|nr:glycosyltransferase family 39 protein [Dissulfurispiraceae bacterium]
MKKIIQFVVIITFTVLTVFLLYNFRSLDDNRLVSWEWVFGTIKITRVLALLVPGCILAYMFSKSPIPDRYPVPFLLILSFAAASLLWREPEVIVDASRYFTEAKHLELYGTSYFIGEWGKAIAVWTDLPLMPLIYGLVFRFLGEARIYVQLVTTLLFSFTVVLTYMIGKTLWDKETGFYGAMFLLGIPYIFTQAPLMLVDIPTMFFVTFAVFAFITALERGGIWTPIASAALFLVIFSKYSAWLMFSLLFIIAAVRLLQIHRSPGEISVRNCMLRIIIPVLSSALAAGVVMLLKHDVFFAQIGLLLSYQKPGLRRWGESFISTFLFQVHPFISAAAAFSVYSAWKKKDPKYLIISWFMILIFALRIKRIRYTIIAFPMFTLMAAYGITSVRDLGLKRQIVFSVAACSLTIAVFAFLPFLQQTSAENLQSAGSFLNTIPGKDLEVITLPRKDDDVNIAVSVPILDLFVNKRIHYRYLPEYFPSNEKMTVSPLRFTWLYKNPDYYEDNGPTASPVRSPLPGTLAIISGEPVDKLPGPIANMTKMFSNSKAFSLQDDAFYHQTIVRVYY